MSENPERPLSGAGAESDLLDDEDVTFAASSDVVARIREQAAELRANADAESGQDGSGEVASGEADPGVSEQAAETTIVGGGFDGAELEGARDLSAFDAYDPTTQMDPAHLAASASAEVQAAPPRARPEVQVASVPPKPKPPAESSAGGESLIAGMAPPASTVSYWSANDVAPTQPVEELVRAKSRLPMWAIIAALIALAIVISVVVAVLVAGGSSETVPIS